MVPSKSIAEIYLRQCLSSHSGLNGRWQLYDAAERPKHPLSPLLLHRQWQHFSSRHQLSINSITSFKSPSLSLRRRSRTTRCSWLCCEQVGKRGSKGASSMEMSSSSLGAAAGDDSFHGLMFGKKIYFEDGGGGLGGNSSNASKAQTPAAAPPAAVQRKGRAVVQGGQQQPPRCQVEGCEADLSGVKAYYCRHKVCGMHSKAPKVVVGGMEQRFCQQCSRFHQLTEFDQGKRSCRRRLAGHNERRRKPPPGPFSSRYSQFAPAFHEPSRFRSFLMDFGYPKLSTTARDTWPTVRPADQVAGNQWHGVPADAPSCVHGGPHHPYLQSSPGRILYPLPELPPGDCVAGASDASCALSLLSTQPWANTNRSQVPPISASSSSFSTATSMAHPFISNNNYMADAWGRSIPPQTRDEMGTARADEARGVHFSSELELALQGNGQCLENGLGREYDHHHHHSAHMIHWSL